MPNISISLQTSDNFPAVAVAVDSYPPRLTAAMREATAQVIRAMERDIRAVYQARAGGQYWDINFNTSATPEGGYGYLYTPPNQPHPIDPRPERVAQYQQALANHRPGTPKPRPPMLRFEKDGQAIYARHVDHPGSQSPDWIEDIESNTTRYTDIFQNEVARVLEGGGNTPGGRGAMPGSAEGGL